MTTRQSNLTDAALHKATYSTSSGKGRAQRLRHLLYFAFAKWPFLATAMIELLLARIRFAKLKPAAILRELQHQDPAPPVSASSAPRTLDVAHITKAIGIVARCMPFRSDCLIQAMAANRWLRRHDLNPNFHLGVAKGANGEFHAHAWLCYGDLTVTGGTSEAFTALIGQDAKRKMAAIEEA